MVLQKSQFVRHAVIENLSEFKQKSIVRGHPHWRKTLQRLCLHTDNRNMYVLKHVKEGLRRIDNVFEIACAYVMTAS